MNENLDLTKILEGCPEGTEFYSSVYGNLTFVKITLFDTIMMMNTRCQYTFTKDGRLYYGVGECVLFPSKDQRDWSKFVRFWDKSKIKKFDVHTLQPFDKVLVRDGLLFEWTCTLFSHIINNVPFSIYCSGGYFRNCIPYNEETKSLVGTKDDCPEFYKWWEE